jgi:enoyl-ACP reductase-like protein
MGGLIAFPGLAPYHPVKHGVLGLTSRPRWTTRSRGLRINAVCPGVVMTEMLAGMMGGEDVRRKWAAEKQPIGRGGEVDEVANTVLWLCSPGSSGQGNQKAMTREIVYTHQFRYNASMCGRFNLRTPMTVLAEQFLFDLGPLAKEGHGRGLHGRADPARAAQSRAQGDQAGHGQRGSETPFVRQLPRAEECNQQWR